MKSNLPRPIVTLAKKIIIPLLKLKWKKNAQVKYWIDHKLITEPEIDWLILNWQKHGKPIPHPPLVKQSIISGIAKQFNCKVLVETGTYKGDMINAQLNNFEDLYTIELSDEYYKDAQVRFKNNNHVHLIHGDSGIQLPLLTPALNKKTLFWLDGHYCGGITAKSEIECPIYNEIDTIMKNNTHRHVILVDDARDFIGQHDYPTLNELSDFVKNYDQNYSFEVIDDIIRILPL